VSSELHRWSIRLHARRVRRFAATRTIQLLHEKRHVHNLGAAVVTRCGLAGAEVQGRDELVNNIFRFGSGKFFVL